MRRESRSAEVVIIAVFRRRVAQFSILNFAVRVNEHGIFNAVMGLFYLEIFVCLVCGTCIIFAVNGVLIKFVFSFEAQITFGDDKACEIFAVVVQDDGTIGRVQDALKIVVEIYDNGFGVANIVGLAVAFRTVVENDEGTINIFVVLVFSRIIFVEVKNYLANGI